MIQHYIAGTRVTYLFRLLISQVKPKDDKETEVVNNPWTNVNRHDDANQPMLHFDLENLSPNSRYHLQIRAKNSEGWSDFSEQIEFKTREGGFFFFVLLN